MKTSEEVLAMEFQVTEEDIREGHRKDCDTCPVARCLQRTTGDKVTAGTGSAEWLSSGKVPGYLLSLPAAARVFIELFDIGGAVTPFTFRFRRQDQMWMAVSPMWAEAGP